jgi:serine/threonine-protein kinase
LRERFLRDAHATTVLSHPNIASLYEIGDEQGHVFLAFEFVPGEPLNALIAGRAINPRRAVDLGIQIADALADGHAAGILHGDIKPDNIIVTPRGNAKILDFGLSAWTGGGAQRRAAAAMTSDSADTVARATVPYMSPGRALGEVDERTDVFSLDCAVRDVDGQAAGSTPVADSDRHADRAGGGAGAEHTQSGLLREVDAIVDKALAKSLERRMNRGDPGGRVANRRRHSRWRTAAANRWGGLFTGTTFFRAVDCGAGACRARGGGVVAALTQACENGFRRAE